MEFISIMENRVDQLKVVKEKKNMYIIWEERGKKGGGGTSSKEEKNMYIIGEGRGEKGGGGHKLNFWVIFVHFVNRYWQYNN